MKHLLLAATAAAALASAAPAAAVVITSLPGGTVLAMPQVNVSGFGPQTLAPGVTWSSTNITSVFGFILNYALTTNGNWNGLPPYVGLNVRTGTMTFAFDTPVSAVGGFLNYAPAAGAPTIAVYDASNVLIESYILSISTPGGQNAGAFFGFMQDTPSIAYFTLSNGGVVMRDLTVLAEPAQDTPEPASLALLAAALCGLGLTRRRG